MYNILVNSESDFDEISLLLIMECEMIKMEMVKISLLEVLEYGLNLKRSEVFFGFRRVINRMSG